MTLPPSSSKQRILLILGVSAFVIFLTNLAIITKTDYRYEIELLPISQSIKHPGEQNKVQTALIAGGEDARIVMLTFCAIIASAAHNS